MLKLESKTAFTGVPSYSTTRLFHKLCSLNEFIKLLNSYIIAFSNSLSRF